DGDPCTKGDTCNSGKCESGPPNDCDDNNVCTIDSCDNQPPAGMAAGCTYTVVGGVCDDGDPCNLGDKCVSGACKAGSVKDCSDGNPCTQDSCVSETGQCKSIPNQVGGACDDDNACTTNDVCEKGGKCFGALKKCDDGKVCTIDKCDTNVGQCFYENNTGQACKDGNGCTLGDSCISGVCQSGSSKLCNDSQPCTDDSCDPQSGACLFKANQNVCDDGNPCTLKDACQAGKCDGTQSKKCDDGNSCTLNSCNTANGLCETKNAADNVLCSDNDLCTQGDACKQGICTTGPPLYCDDNNPCTTDACVAQTGKCSYVPNSIPCDDGNSCTENDGCQAGKCTGGKNVCECQKTSDCAAKDDGNPCNGTLFCELASNSCKVDSNTVVICDPSKNTPCTGFSCNPKTGKCEGGAKPNDSACEADQSVCTQGDKCSEGVCIKGKVQTCNDNNPCTNDQCDPTKGCVFPVNIAPCFDGDLCTKNDVCSKGKCEPGNITKSCSDNDACTSDTCDPKTGKCNFLPLSGPSCDDGNACTTGDSCAKGGCTPGQVKKCDDGNPCTLDVCDTKNGNCGAKPAFDGLGCDDGKTCTKGVTCDKGICKAGSVPNCDDGSPCTKGICIPTTGNCKQLATGNGKPCNDGNACTLVDVCKNGFCLASDNKLCNDSNPCTTDSCDKDKGVCVYQPLAKGAQCSDSDLCTLGDACDGQGLCKPTKSAVCDDKNPCTSDSCDPTSGLCKYVAAPPNPVIKCDDGDACTYDKAVYGATNQFSDTCSKGKCVGAKRSCNDGNVCTKDSCDPKKGCQHKFLGAVSCNDGNACTTGDNCTTGKCKGQGKTCADGNACTKDTCDPKKGCIFPFNTSWCNDGNICTASDQCKNGTCVGKTTDCNDDNQCTDDSCSPKTGCIHASDDTNPCSDGLPCTAKDTCKSGKCVANGVTDCDDANPCTMDKCVPTVGCKQTADDSKPCDDGNKCTSKDACVQGKCVATGSVNCNDGNICTTDACNPKTGCSFTPNSDTCDDGNACTENDACAKLACKAGPVVICNDNVNCTNDNCDPKNGCSYTPATGSSQAALKIRSDFQTQTWTFFKTENGVQAPGNLQAAAVTIGGSAGWTAKISGASWIWRSAEVTDSTKDQTVWFERGFSVPPSAKQIKATLSAAGDDDYQCWLNGTLLISHKASSGNGAAKIKSTTATSQIQVGANTLRCKVTNIGKAATSPKTNPAGLLFGLDASFTVDQLGCDDGNACTALDVCDKGVCTGLNGVQCNDDNPCTKDVCDPAKGCLELNANGAACSDGDACTSGDVCKSGKCTVAKVADCDDGNLCTIDVCDKFSGCKHTAQQLGITQGLVGTSGTKTLATTTFQIVGGTLIPTDLKPAVATYDGFNQWAKLPGATWIWNSKFVTEPSKDQTVFFVHNFTVPAGVEALNGMFEVSADESYLCRLNGLLVGTSTATKPWLALATLPLGTALKTGQNQLLCEVKNLGKAGSNLLNNPAGLLFRYSLNWYDKGKSKPCDDGNKCTQNDSCDSKGNCISGPPKSCDDNNACTIDACSNTKGCQHLNNDKAQCNDGSICSEGDFCQKGQCVGKSGLSCDDKNPCTADACDPFKGCVFPAIQGTPKCTDGGKCAVDTACSGGKCLGTAKNCGDGNPCTDDSCDPTTGCVNSPNNSNACDDGNSCTANDLCKNGQCLGQKTAPCDDGNDCTKDFCDTMKGCSHTSTTGTVCEDGDACTLQDVCLKGVCVAGAKKSCFDTEQCTVDTCDSKTGKCLFSALSDGACDDGNLCTLNDTCVAGKCISGKSPPCADNDPCTLDNCAPKTGKCLHEPAKESSSCDDGNLCTSGSKCVSGQCLGVAKDCDDKSPCTADSCEPATGACQYSAANDGASCANGGVCKKGVCI
ncbi:MAG TPA: hypothetical protein DCQ06_01110, partial [Myxococcales bacterium]|nr:hypothetical protein [Myxococcales bacterium]